MKMFVVVMGAMFAVSACGKKEEAAAGGGAAAGGAGGNLPASCQKLMDTAKACFAKAGDAGKAAQGAFDQQAKAWEDAAKAGADAAAALETGCKTAYDQMKGSMGALCPDVKWE